MGVHHVPLFLVVILGSFLQTRQDNAAIVKSCQHTDVLLPCICSGMAGGLKWQKDETRIYSNNRIIKNNKYTDRITMFLNETSKDCSILLKNISEEDGGKYNCNFKKEGGAYSLNTVMLIIINSTECPVTASSVKGDNSTSNNSPSTYIWNIRLEVYIPLIIISALLLVGCIFAFLRIRLRNQPSKTDEEAALDCKNPGTLSEDSSDKKCLQAPLILALCYRADMDQEKERPHCLL